MRLHPPAGGEQVPLGGLAQQAPAVHPLAVVRRMWPLAAAGRRWLPLLVLLVAVPALVEGGQLLVFQAIVDDVLTPRRFAALAPLAATFLGLTVLGGLADSVDTVVSVRTTQQFVLSLRTAVFEHLQRLSLGFFERHQLGDVMARLTDDVTAIETFVLSGVVDAVAAIFTTAVYAVILLVLDWQIAVISFVAAPLLWWLSRWSSTRLLSASRDAQASDGAIGAVAQESLSNVALVQAYNRQDFEVERFAAQGARRFAAERASARVRALFTPLVDLAESGGSVVVIGAGTWALAQHRLSLGGLLVFVTVLGRLYVPVRELTELVNDVAVARASAERVLELLDERPAVTQPPGARPLGPVQGHVQLDHVTFSYPGTQRKVLDDVTVSVPAGRTVALVGPSGAGKSSVVKLLLRFYDPSGGAVRIDGHDLRDVDLGSLREDVAVLLQDNLVFDDTVAANIAYGRPGATRAQVEAAARAADAHEFITALPDGYGSVIGQHGRLLSGGQRQRIAIARAMIRDAPVLVLDEPTTGLDGATTERLLVPLRRLMTGRTTVLVTHDPLLAREADLVVVLEDGRVAQTGTHDELLTRGGAYARLHQRHLAAPVEGRSARVRHPSWRTTRSARSGAPSGRLS